MTVKKIEIYKTKYKVNIPVSNYEFANCGPNGLIIILGDEVYVQDINNKREEQFAKAEITSKYIIINPQIFEQIA